MCVSTHVFVHLHMCVCVAAKLAQSAATIGDQSDDVREDNNVIFVLLSIVCCFCVSNYTHQYISNNSLFYQ